MRSTLQHRRLTGLFPPPGVLLVVFVVILLCTSVLIVRRFRSDSGNHVEGKLRGPVTAEIQAALSDPGRREPSIKNGVEGYTDPVSTLSANSTGSQLVELFPEGCDQTDPLRQTTTTRAETVEDSETTVNLETDYLNPFVGVSKYIGKKVCRSKATWMDITRTWTEVSAQLGSNCSLVYGNLVVAGVKEDDDISALDNIEEISGYLIIHSVGRAQLRFPKLRLIRGQEFVQVRKRRVALLVSSNYLQRGHGDRGNNESASAKNPFTFLLSLEMPNLISIIQHGVYFYDNPGLCYAPFTLNWADLLESAELQTVDLYPIQARANLTRWLAYCQCRHLGNCSTRAGVGSAVTRDTEAQETTTSGYGETDAESTYVTESEFPILTTGITPVYGDGSEGQGNVEVPLVTEASAPETAEKPVARTKRGVRLAPRALQSPESFQSLNDPDTKKTHSNNEAPGQAIVQQLNKTIPKATTFVSNSIPGVELMVPDNMSPSVFGTPTESKQASWTMNSAVVGPAHVTDAVEQMQNDMQDSIDSHQTAKPTKVSDEITATIIPITVPIDQRNYDARPQPSGSDSSEDVTKHLVWEAPMVSGAILMNNSNFINGSEQTPRLYESIRLPCHPSCPPIRGTRYCWGPEANQCQTTHKCQIQLCDGSNWCFRTVQNSTRASWGGAPSSRGPSEHDTREHCCHSECAAGCSGAGSRDCNACLRYSHDGNCVPTCPATRVYNKTTYTWNANPNGLLAFGWTCVKQCPTNYLRDGDSCVSSCARPGTFPQNGQCVTCSADQCPRTCSFGQIEQVKGIDYLRRSSLRAMRNCTTFQGDIKLSRQSFVGDPFHNLTKAEEGVRWQDLVEGLSELRELTGILYISAGSDAPWLTNLTFLAKLEVIGGVSPHVLQTRAININSNLHLEFLGLTSLRSITHPTILITGNPNLCFLDTIQWESFVPSSQPTSPASPVAEPESSISPTVTSHPPLLLPLGTRRSARQLTYALRERLRKELERRVIQDLLSQATSKINRPRSYPIPTIFLLGNAHPEFCRGKDARCAEQCVPQLGCWGPGPLFCRACQYWSVTRADGKRLCVDQCEEVNGHFTPNHTETLASTAQPTAAEPASAMGFESISQRDKLGSSTNRQCGACSPNCRSDRNACFGPGADQCIGPCQWVKDGPYCRHKCPPEKFEDPVSHTCENCDPSCSQPVWPPKPHGTTTNRPLIPEAVDLHAVCTGRGNWPGEGGCSYCRQTVLRVRDEHGKRSMQLECVEACPSETYLHVLNLHYRGGSSDYRLPTLLATSDRDPNENGESYAPWTHTDGALFKQFPEDVRQQLARWLLNHTQPQLYGVARVCLPCHEQCARPGLPPSGIADNPWMIAGASPVCYGPGPEKCVRCANTSYLGRCVSQCPEGTYEAPRWPQVTNFQSSGRLKELAREIQHLYRIASSSNDHSTWLKQAFQWHECLPCHSLCYAGCSGPSSTQCNRCRVVKIFLNRAKTKWRCGFNCPTLYRYQVRDHHTGDLVCSTRADRIRIFLDSSHDLVDHMIHVANQSSSSAAVDWEQADELDVPDELKTIEEFNVHFYLSGELAGMLAASVACLTFLLALSGIIYWAVLQQPARREPEFAEWLDKPGKTSLWYRMCISCERLWTRGRPRPADVGSSGQRKPLLLNPAGQVRLTKEKKHSYTVPDSSSRVDLAIGSVIGGSEYPVLGSVGQVEGNDDAIRDRNMPNMATLRIITESELVRGPLIGSGAFGTVFCGIWRPQKSNKIMPALTVTSPPVSVRTVSTSVSVDTEWPDRLDVSWMGQRHVGQTLVGASGTSTTSTGQQSPTNSAGNETYAEIPVAIKVLTDTADAQTNKELLEEAKVMATVDHPCCLRFLALCLTSRLQLVTQYMPLGSLLDFVKTRSDLVEVSILMRWAHQIASGMAYLSMRGIIHRDLAARNVLVESLEQVRITDFGLSKCLEFIESEYHASGGRMPIKWLAIESIQDRIFSSKSDVWAYGVTVWEMCTFGRKPYAAIRARDLLSYLEQGKRLPQPETVSLELYTTLLLCWESDPARRPNFTDLCIAMEKMNENPSRYLFITARLKAQQKVRANRSVSEEALEFLTSTLTTTTSSFLSGQTLDSPTGASQTALNSIAETEYIQMQAEWMRTLYVNSRVTAFPKCVQQLIDNNYTYLTDVPTARKTSNSKMSEAYCSLAVRPVETNNTPAAARPNTLAIPWGDLSSEKLSSGTRRCSNTAGVAEDEASCIRPLPTQNILVEAAEADTLRPNIKQNEWKAICRPTNIDHSPMDPISMGENKPELLDQTGDRDGNLETNETNDLSTATSIAPDPPAYVMLEDYLEPRSVANEPVQV